MNNGFNNLDRDIKLYCRCGALTFTNGSSHGHNNGVCSFGGIGADGNSGHDFAPRMSHTRIHSEILPISIISCSFMQRKMGNPLQILSYVWNTVRSYGRSIDYSQLFWGKQKPS
eukprot:759523_1